MTKYMTSPLAALLVASFLVAIACAPNPVRQDKGTVTILIGGSAGRALTTGWPDGALPVFSSVKIKVSAPDMADVETSITNPGNSITLTAPSGNGRLVEINAVPNWTATAAARPNAKLPVFANAYGGSAKVNLPAGGTVPVAITLSLTETKTLLPDYTAGNTLKIASELSSSAVIQTTTYSGGSQYFIDSNSDFVFDNRGYLYFNGPAGINRYSFLNGEFTTEMVMDWPPGDLAFDVTNQRMYIFHDPDVAALVFYDVTASTATQFEVVSPDGYNGFTPGSIAVDKDGYIYAPIIKYISDVPYYSVAKLALGAQADIVFGTQLIAVADFSALGLTDGTNLKVEDMTIVDGKLYIAAGEHDPYGNYHRGKIVEVDTSNMAKLREFGWSPTGLPSSPSTQFYGPKRFLAVAPRKLIVADEGALSGANIDRVAEVDLSSGAIDGIWFLNTVNFFSDYISY